MATKTSENPTHPTSTIFPSQLYHHCMITIKTRVLQTPLAKMLVQSEIERESDALRCQEEERRDRNCRTDLHTAWHVESQDTEN